MIRTNNKKSAKLYVERNRQVHIAFNDFQEKSVVTPEKRKERVYVVHTIPTF